ncbi:MAG: YigZ family protein [Prolixibacteraceae bacterium]|nr:YigZ family protein [Prolixibacteraceae bacterium]
MRNNDFFRTIDKPSEGLFKDKGSKFIAYAYPVSDENQIKSYIQSLKDQHYKARHHCYAYRLGKDGEQYRANDDGEPSGTAGRPIHGQLMSYDVTNVLIVVVRYFGGTLLGTSGLINAYKTASIEALKSADIIEKIVSDHFKIQFSYTVQSHVERLIKEYDLTIDEAVYNVDCTYEISVRKNLSDAVLDQMEKIEGATVTVLSRE